MAVIVICVLFCVTVPSFTIENNGQSGTTPFTNTFAELFLRHVEANASVINSSRESVRKTVDAGAFEVTTLNSLSSEEEETSAAGDSIGWSTANTTEDGTDWGQGTEVSSHPPQQMSSSGISPFPLSPSVATTTAVRGCRLASWKASDEHRVNITKTFNVLDQWTKCGTTIAVPAGNTINAFFEDFHAAPHAGCSVEVSICLTENSTDCRKTTFSNNGLNQPCCQDFYRFNQDTIYLSVNAYQCFLFNIQFHVRMIPLDLYNTLPVVNKTANSGYVTTPGFDEDKKYPFSMDATFELNITMEEVVLVSFPHFDLENHTACRYDSLKLCAVNDSGVFPVKLWCGFQDIPSMVFHTSIRLSFISDYIVQNTGFKMMFTILPRDKEPRMLGDDLFSCSHFEDYAQHFNCNLAVNCERLEDERDCDYTSQECGPGLFDAGDKCYMYSRLQPDLSWYEAYSQCLDINQTLVSPRNPREWSHFVAMTQHGRRVSTVYTGLRTWQASGAAVPAMYQGMWQWADKTVGLYVHLDVQRNSVPSCTKFHPLSSADRMQTVSCVQPRNARYVCEKWKPSVNVSSPALLMPSLPSNYSWSKNASVVPCPSGHVVRDFLSCDLQSRCLEERYASPCVLQGQISFFQCDHSSQSVHYTLVCDFRFDCSDGSDESWCVTDHCPEDSCRSGQCISNKHRCDGMLHCIDASDENCPQIIQTGPVPVSPPALVTFDGRGQYSLRALNYTDRCPHTHFKCADSYCLPHFVRCNGVEDCPGHEDEAGCEGYTCPGFFRCRGSLVCLHPDHVCDGVLHCPQHDDERLCDMTCPDVCHCQGLAFACSKRFYAPQFPSLRYLDVSGSGMTLIELKENFFLVHLRMSRCRLKGVVHVNLPNLRILDLSDNSLISLNLDSFLPFTNLQVLIMSGNPLTDVYPVTLSTIHLTLRSLSLSGTRLTTINGSVFKNFPNMKELNLSTEYLTSITEGFSSTPDLEVLDVRGSYHLSYPSDMIRDLASLRALYANDFKLCCRTALPEGFDQENCYAPNDDIASCEDLLRSDVYRVVLWVFALLAVLGNVGSFVARFYLRDRSFHSRGQSSFNVLVTNLSVADFLMGVYLTIIGVADHVYRGQYVWYAKTWKNSVACQTAGFLSLASSEVSAFFICLITLDRLMILRFPFGKLRFRKKSVLVVTAVAWIVGLVLAAVPLLPMSPSWDFYSQTGICIPLPFSNKDQFRGYLYSFVVIIALNLLLFLLIAVGQVFIYVTVRASSMAPAKKKASRDSAIARRLTTIVLSDFLCWFPVGLLGLLALAGVPIPVDVRVGIAICVLPFNSALNPFLYTFNIIMEKRRKAIEARMLERLESRHFTELSRMPAQLTVTKETALNQIEAWLGVRVISMSDLASRFDMMPKMADTSSSLPQ